MSALPKLHLHSRPNTGFNGLGKDNCKKGRETFKFGEPYIRGKTIVHNGYNIFFMAGDSVGKNDVVKTILKGNYSIVFSSNFSESMEYLFNWLWVTLKILWDDFGVIHWVNKIKMIHLLMPYHYKTHISCVWLGGLLTRNLSHRTPFRPILDMLESHDTGVWESYVYWRNNWADVEHDLCRHMA